MSREQILEKQLEYATQALKDIYIWTNEIEDKWEHPATRALQALEDIDETEISFNPFNSNV